MRPGDLDSSRLAAVIRRDASIANALHDTNLATQGRGSGFEVLARRVGIPERSLRRVCEQEGVTLDFADRYCIASGRHLWEVYPELYAA